ncbi:MAG: hypothetical protein LCH81_07980 [Bacteroidetes bacterium]|nr:hypothetical protein [Bacteroidota bacterium]
MKKNAVDLPRRYPGLKPFERSQSAVFHGRQDDIQRLSNLILRERLVVLFAKSGIGKTSLLQAGVAPEIERQDYTPVFLRADKTGESLVDSMSALLSNHVQVGGRDTTGERPGEKQTLWEQMKRLEFDLNGLPATPVLVFDQFEEIFTLAHGEESRNRFLAELADLANETMPEALRASLLGQFQAGKIDVNTMQWWEKQPELRVVLSIRSDFLHLIDGLSARIPGILRNRYQLQPLDRDKARTAIVQPAQAEGTYLSPPFSYNEAALEGMIDFLAGHTATENDAGNVQAIQRKDEIEAVNLQIVCQDIEEKIIDEDKAAGFAVVPEFYGGQQGLNLSIRNFYHNQLLLFPKAYVERMLNKAQQGTTVSEKDRLLTEQTSDQLYALAQRLIEESLITSSNRRNSVVDDTLLDEYGVTADFLDTLVDKSRLLRKEPRLDDFYYEISHDTLLPAIIESRNNRRDKERADREKLEYEQRLTEESRRREEVEEQLKTSLKQRQLARKVAITSIFALVISLVALAFSGYFLRDYLRSTRSQLAQAELNVSNEIFDAAVQDYEELIDNARRSWILKNTPPYKDVKEELVKVKKLQSQYDTLDFYVLRSDSLTFTADYAGALHAYRDAQVALLQYKAMNFELSAATDSGRVWRVDSTRIELKFLDLTRRVINLRETLVRNFEVSQRNFEVFKEAKVWGQAIRNLEKMKRLLPHEPEDMEVLRQALVLNESPADYVERELKFTRRMLGR